MLSYLCKWYISFCISFLSLILSEYSSDNQWCYVEYLGSMCSSLGEVQPGRLVHAGFVFVRFSFAFKDSLFMLLWICVVTLSVLFNFVYIPHIIFKQWTNSLRRWLFTFVLECVWLTFWLFGPSPCYISRVDKLCSLLNQGTNNELVLKYLLSQV